MQRYEQAGDIDLRGTREPFILSNAAVRHGDITTPVTL
jgi:hypothetical protein